MSIEYNVLNILKEYSSKEAAITLKVTDIVTYMHKDYDKSITDKQVRKALKDLTDSELNLPDEQKVIRYRTYDNERRKTDYYYNNIITDVEFKFLIDSVLYSNIFNNERAMDLAGRIQTLSGKNLKNITSYANTSFGQTRYAQNSDVLANCQLIIDAIKNDNYIEFDWNVYDVKNKNVYLHFQGRRTVIPIRLMLNNGRYFCLVRYRDSRKVYTYSVDLMTRLRVKEQRKSDGIGFDNLDIPLERAVYILNHPYMMGGELRPYIVRIDREYFSRLIDDFSYEINVLKETDTTVDIRVNASCKGMAYWLCQHYDIASIVDNKDKELNKELKRAAESILRQVQD